MNQSLKKKIYGFLCITSGISVIVTAVLSVWLFYGVFLRQVSKDLAVDASMMKYAYGQGMDMNELVGSAQGLRLTIVTEQGDVVLESDADLDAMENHGDRPEIQDALENGRGEAVRQSDTLEASVAYYALRLDDGNVLRLGMKTHSIWQMFVSIFPGVIAGVVVLILLALFVSSKLTKRIVVPIEQMVEDLDTPEKILPYDELAPFSLALKRKNEDISRQMELLQEQRAQMGLITSNMDEGLLMMDPDQIILMANTSAIRMLGGQGKKYEGKHLFFLSRNEQLGNCINGAAQGEQKSMEADVDGKVIRFLASPVYSDGKITGIICFLLDVTGIKRAERMRQEFTANVSHELKTPLTSVCGYAELLANGLVKKDTVQDFGKTIYQESVRLLSLITDILKLSELDNPIDLPKPQLCNLCTSVQDCVEALDFLAGKQGVNLHFEGTECSVYGNREMLEQLIRNLCDNAIRYNHPGGNVTVTVKQEDGKAVLTVKDTGIGIPREHQDRIFERFYRVDKSRSKATGGTGLGLAIVKYIAEYHEATLELESEEGEGTKITVRFPLA